MPTAMADEQAVAATPVHRDRKMLVPMPGKSNTMRKGTSEGPVAPMAARFPRAAIAVSMIPARIGRTKARKTMAMTTTLMALPSRLSA